MNEKVILPDSVEKETFISKISVKMTDGCEFNAVLGKGVEKILLLPDRVHIVREGNEATILPMQHIVWLKFGADEKIVPKVHKPNDGPMKGVVEGEATTENKKDMQEPSA